MSTGTPDADAQAVKQQVKEQFYRVLDITVSKAASPTLQRAFSLKLARSTTMVAIPDYTPLSVDISNLKIESLTKEQLFEASLAILQKNEPRSKQEYSVLQNVLSSVSMFSECRANSPVFKDIPETQFFSDLADCLEYQFVEKGTPLFHMGDIGDRMYILLKGEACLYFKKKAEELIEDEGKQKSWKAANLIEPEEWDQYIEALGDQEIAYYSKGLFDSVNKGVIKPYELLTFGIGKLPMYHDKELTRFKQFLIYKTGSIFGEVALIRNQTRMGTLVLTQDSHLAILKKDKFNYFFEGKAIMDKQNKEFLKQVFHLPPDIMDRIPFYFSRESFTKGSILYKQNTPITNIYIIRIGSVEVRGG